MAIPCPNCEVLLPETQGEIKKCDVCGYPVNINISKEVRQ